MKLDFAFQGIEARYWQPLPNLTDGRGRVTGVEFRANGAVETALARRAVVPNGVDFSTAFALRGSGALAALVRGAAAPRRGRSQELGMADLLEGYTE